MRKAAQLFKHNRFARLFAVSKACELLFEDAGAGEENNLLLSFRVESERREFFDDLVETRKVAGTETLVGWQIKDQYTPLKKDVFEQCLSALIEQQDLATGHFAVPTPVSVNGLGPLTSLRSLCDRFQSPNAGPGLVIEGAAAEEQKWFDFAAAIVGNRDGTPGLLRRLRIHFIGDERALQDRARGQISCLFRPPLDPVLATLEAFVAGLDGVSTIDADTLRAALSEHSPQLHRHLDHGMRRKHRTTFLAAVARVSKGIEALPATAGTGIRLSAALQDVYVQPHLSDRAGDTCTLLGWLGRRRSPRLVVLGEVGSGKSSLLARLQESLGQLADGDSSAPLPILLRAGDMQADAPLTSGARRLGLAPRCVTDLSEDPMVSWLVLIDGADELPNPWPRIDSLIAQLNTSSRVAGVVVATRPVARSDRGDFEELRIQEWGTEELDSFLGLWRAQEASAVEALVSTEHYGELRDTLLTNPLMATLCLVLAKETGKVPRERARIFVDVLAMLFESWRSARNEPILAFHQLAPALGCLAFRILCSNETTFTAAELRDELRRADVTPVMPATDEALRSLGIFVGLEGGRLAFLQKPFAEHLAAQHFRSTETEITELVYEGWSEEVARHAIGLHALDNRSSADEELQRLVAPLEGLHETEAVFHLRPLQIALRAAHDIGPETLSTTSTLARLSSQLLVEENSCWLGGRIASELLPHARSHTLLWTEVLAAVLPHFESGLSPAQWYSEHLPDDVEERFRLLEHRDPLVRSLVLSRLSNAELTASVGPLVRQLFDPAGTFGRGLAPAVAAGLRLREIPRPLGPNVLRLLTMLVSAGGQLQSGAAALALRSTEAEPETLVPALKVLAEGYGYPIEVVKLLSSTPEAREVFDQEWPDWRETFSRHHPVPIPNAPGDTRPLSPTALARVLDCCDGSTSTGDLEQLLARRSPARDRTLCRLIAAGATHLARQHDLFGLQFDAQRLLRGPAARDPEVRAALFDCWETVVRERRTLRPFPIMSLETLLVEGDQEATEIFEQWLAGLLQSGDQPLPMVFPTKVDQRIFRSDSTRQLATALTGRCIDLVEVGEMRREQRTRVAIAGVASWFQFARCVWERDDSVVETLGRWLGTNNTNEYRGTLACLDGANFADAFATAVVHEVLTKLASYRRGERGWYLHDAQGSIRFLVGNGLAAEQPVIELLESAQSDESPLAVSAVAALIPQFEPSRAAQMSCELAPKAIGYDAEHLSDAELQVLVGAAPTAWSEALEEHLATFVFPRPSTFIRVLRALPSGLRTTTARRIYPSVANWELPWSNDDSRSPIGRPADVLRMLLFDGGLNLLDLA